MLNTNYNIAAISSAGGQAGRMIVRITGPGAISSAGNVFTPDSGSLPDYSGFSRIPGQISVGDIIMPAACYLFRAPNSYTRQDLIEIHLPGNPALAQKVLDKILASEVVLASAGEFTMRAFLSGRIDLSQAAAVADIINADNEAQLRAAELSASGKLSELCSKWTLALTELLALVEASIDLDEEGIETISPKSLAQAFTELASVMDFQLLSAARPAGSATLARVLLVGRPNAGKSSLINAIAGTGRQIVSDIPGTTRDTVETCINLTGNHQAIFIDSAGLDFDSDATLAPDTNIESNHPDVLASIRTRTEAQAADLIIAMSDISGGAESCRTLVDKITQMCQLPQSHIIATLSKADTVPPEQAAEIHETLAKSQSGPTANCSARSDGGTADIISRITNILENSPLASDSRLLLHSRQREAIGQCTEILTQAATQLDGCDNVCDLAELLSCDIREAIEQLGEIAGHNIGENVLSEIFSRFCVGK